MGNWTTMVGVGILGWTAAMALQEPLSAQAEPAPAAKKQTEKPAKKPADRFTAAQVKSMVAAMKKCGSDAKDRIACACRSDLTLSKAAKPKDAEKRCAAYEELLMKPRTASEELVAFELAAPDISPGTLIASRYAEDCERAVAPDDKRCACLTTHFANRMAREDLATIAKLFAAVKKIGKELAVEAPCGSKP